MARLSTFLRAPILVWQLFVGWLAALLPKPWGDSQAQVPPFKCVSPDSVDTVLTPATVAIVAAPHQQDVFRRQRRSLDRCVLKRRSASRNFERICQLWCVTCRSRVSIRPFFPAGFAFFVTASVIFWLLSSIRNVRSEARFLYYLVTAINAVRLAALTLN